MTRSVTFEIPDSPRAVMQRSSGKTIVVIRIEDARTLVERLVFALNRAKYVRADADDS